jgi:hypothetical protein
MLKWLLCSMPVVGMAGFLPPGWYGVPVGDKRVSVQSGTPKDSGGLIFDQGVYALGVVAAGSLVELRPRIINQSDHSITIQSLLICSRYYDLNAPTVLLPGAIYQPVVGFHAELVTSEQQVVLLAIMSPEEGITAQVHYSVVGNFTAVASPNGDPVLPYADDVKLSMDPNVPVRSLMLDGAGTAIRGYMLQDETLPWLTVQIAGSTATFAVDREQIRPEELNDGGRTHNIINLLTNDELVPVLPLDLQVQMGAASDDVVYYWCCSTQIPFGCFRQCTWPQQVTCWQISRGWVCVSCPPPNVGVWYHPNQVECYDTCTYHCMTGCAAACPPQDPNTSGG